MVVEIPLKLGKSCTVRVTARLQWKSVSQEATVDTGATKEGLGLVIPRETLPGTQVHGFTTLRLANGQRVRARYVPGAVILQIGDRKLPEPIETGAVLLTGGETLLGMDVLRRGTLLIDGPGRRASLKI